jgi:hypothetical protein
MKLIKLLVITILASLVLAMSTQAADLYSSEVRYAAKN